MIQLLTIVQKMNLKKLNIVHLTIIIPAILIFYQN